MVLFPTANSLHIAQVLYSASFIGFPLLKYSPSSLLYRLIRLVDPMVFFLSF